MVRRNKEANGRNKDKKTTQSIGRRNKENRARKALELYKT